MTRIGVFGAGAVGGYLGAALSAAGAPVVLVGRRSLLDVRAELCAVPLGAAALMPGDDLVVTDDPRALSDVDVCLVTVKSGDTGTAGQTLRDVLPPGALVVSFQNGLDNAGTLRAALAQPVAAGVVGYNVRRDGGRMVQATTGVLLAERLAGEGRLEDLRATFARVGFELGLRADIDAVLAGKLLVNLNNGVCAATGLNIAAALRDPDARRCFAACIDEGRRVMRASGLRPANVVGVPPAVVARVLRWPDALLRPFTRLFVRIDPSARSSTLQDLDRGRPTEVDALNGALVALAARAGVPAPVNAHVVEVVRGLERDVARGDPPGFVAAAELRRALEAL